MDSDEEDVVPATPEPKVKKRKAVSSSDSDSEDKWLGKKAQTPKKVKKEEEKSKLKPVNVLDALGSAPVKQSKVEKKTPVKSTEKVEVKKGKGKGRKRENEDLEKTLLQLDEDLLVGNMDVLDRTIEEATNNGKIDSNGTPKKTKVVVEPVTPKPGSARKRKVSEDGSEETPEDRLEKKRHSAMLYKQYLHRPAPKNHGKKEIPNVILRRRIFADLHCNFLG